ncbi:beta-1,3-glucan-binding protein [Toxorhynchites rutilus septentrionalis]|uniref:beta-1,3-glucan-binding protein n=1 Tax=Toxorhynchites rutilus septentrionalis TaxID=329112 RepID=UPI002478E9F0|nr:beta-1,3-glucan-binding protein [Toxorhynchites rutilus septentrionalis]
MKQVLLIVLVYFIRGTLCMNGGKFSVPDVLFEYLTPKGFRASIPDTPGIKLFAFHARVNSPFSGFEEGDFTQDVSAPENGHWVFETTKANVKEGQSIYYWFYVQHNDKAYWVADKKHIVRKNMPATTTTTTTTTEKPKTTKTKTTKTTTTTAPPCMSTVTTVNGGSTCAGNLIFEDTFQTLDLSKWQREVRIPLDTESAEFVSYQASPENSYVAGGHLFIVPTLLNMDPTFNDERIRTGELILQGCTSPTNNEHECRRQAALSSILPPVVSAKLNTKSSFRFQYGRVEIRAKLPKGDWIFPHMLLQPAENYYGYADIGSGMLVVAHLLSNEELISREGIQIDGHRLRGGAIITNRAKLREAFLKANVLDEHFSDGFHVYGLTWKPDGIILSVDGFQYATLKGKFKDYGLGNGLSQANLWNAENALSPFDREFYISLGVGVGGVTDFPDFCRTGTLGAQKPWNNTSPKAEYHFYQNRNTWFRTWTNPELIVDYVRVYAL